MSTHIVQLRVYVTVEVDDESVFDRGNEELWASSFYGKMTKDDMIGHFAWNAILNGVNDASVLDGWADVPVGSVKMNIDDAEVDYIDNC